MSSEGVDFCEYAAGDTNIMDSTASIVYLTDQGRCLTFSYLTFLCIEQHGLLNVEFLGRYAAVCIDVKDVLASWQTGAADVHGVILAWLVVV